MAKFIDEIYQLRPWYHDFDSLGIQTVFPNVRHKIFFWKKIRGIRNHAENQPRKESVIRPYIEKSLGMLSHVEHPNVLDLFCADGYYGFLTKSLCPEATITGVDLNERDVGCARVMSKQLGYSGTQHIVGDCNEFVESTDQSFDLILNTGGLYHIEDPRKLLESIRKLNFKYLVLQSAITSEHNDPDYFETPHPGWTWGSWFSHAKLESWIKELDFQILDSTTNEREGENKAKVGASYFLLAKPD